MKTTSQNTRVRNVKKARQRMAEAALGRAEPRRRRRHFLPVGTTEESQWESGPAPQVKTSRMFLAMLALHVVAVGGLIAFHFFGRDGESPKPVANPDKKEGAATPSVKPAAPKARIVPDEPVASQNRKPLPAGYIEHIIREDETGESIANGNGLTFSELRQANPDVDAFYAGRRIVIPPRRNVVSAVPDDTAKRLAETKRDPMHYPTNTGAALNQYATNPEAGGNSVVKSNAPAAGGAVPGGAAPPRAKIATDVPRGEAVKVTEKKPGKATSSTYVVQRGDTLYSIYRDTGVSVASLQKLNGLSNTSKLQPGQRLKLSAGK